MKITDEMVDAAANVLLEAGCLPHMTHARDFTDEQIYIGELRLADQEAHRKNLEIVRTALEAALRKV